MTGEKRSTTSWRMIPCFCRITLWTLLLVSTVFVGSEGKTYLFADFRLPEDGLQLNGDCVPSDPTELRLTRSSYLSSNFPLKLLLTTTITFYPSPLPLSPS